MIDYLSQSDRAVGRQSSVDGTPALPAGGVNGPHAPEGVPALVACDEVAYVDRRSGGYCVCTKPCDHAGSHECRCGAVWAADCYCVLPEEAW